MSSPEVAAIASLSPSSSTVFVTDAPAAAAAAAAGATSARKVLLPVDGSKHSDRAVAWFLENLHRPGDFAVLAFVLEPPQRSPTEPQAGGGGGCAFVREGNQAYNEGLKEAGRLKAKFYQAFRSAGVPEAEVHFQELVGSRAGETLIRYIAEAGISCVVIGSRGLGKLRRAFLGSVSSHVLHHAGCPVIICPDKKKESKEDNENASCSNGGASGSK